MKRGISVTPARGPRTRPRARLGVSLLAGLAAAIGPAAAPALAAGAGGAGNESARTFEASETWLAMDTLTAAAARDGRAVGLLQVDAGLEIRDPALRDRAVMLRPRLRDAYSTALADYIGRFHRPGAAPDAARIGDLLQQATDRTLGQPGADLLLAMVVLH